MRGTEVKAARSTHSLLNVNGGKVTGGKERVGALLDFRAAPNAGESKKEEYGRNQSQEVTSLLGKKQDLRKIKTFEVPPAL